MYLLLRFASSSLRTADDQNSNISMGVDHHGQEKKGARGVDTVMLCTGSPTLCSTVF